MRSGCPGANRILGAWPLPITFRRHFFERGSCPPNHRLRESCGGGEGKGLGGATLPRAISAAIREDFGTKTEVSHDEGFISARHRGLLFGRRKNPQVRASLNSRATDGPRLPPWDTSVFVPRFVLGLYYFRLARHSDSEEQLVLPSVRFACLLPEATPYGYRAAILRMPCNLDASSSIPISSSAW